MRRNANRTKMFDSRLFAFIRGPITHPQRRIQNRREWKNSAQLDASHRMHPGRRHASAFRAHRLASELARADASLQIRRKAGSQSCERALLWRAWRTTVAIDYHPRQVN